MYSNHFKQERETAMKIVLMIMMLFSASACMGIQENQASAFPIQKITVTLTAPDAGWRVRILEVHRLGKELWVVSEAYRMKGMSSQVISTIEDMVEIAAPPLPVVHFIMGKTWAWSDERDSNRYIDSRDDIPAEFDKGECLFQRRE